MLTKLLLSIINFARRNFRNTWVHRIPLTSFVYKKVFAMTFRGKDINIEFRGNKYTVPTTDTTVVPSMISGDFERYELDVYNSLIKKGFLILDIGANIGVYSIEASRHIGENGQVHAFEPISENIAFLKQNLLLNNAHNVTVQNCAIGKEGGAIKIYKAKHNIGTHSMGRISNSFEEVAMTSIDSFVGMNSLKVDLIKIDVEGGEGYAIEGGLETIKSQQPLLFIEFSSPHLQLCGYSPKIHAATLLSLYQFCYMIDEQKKTFVRVESDKVIARQYNTNLVLSSKPINF